jgi:hypothetical protein
MIDLGDFLAGGALKTKAIMQEAGLNEDQTGIPLEERKQKVIRVLKRAIAQGRIDSHARVSVTPRGQAEIIVQQGH